MEKTQNMLSDLASDVLQGLTAKPKRLSSRFFYDRQGDRLFQQIMELPEYYLTRLEYEILVTRKSDIGQLFLNSHQAFDLVDLGAGDAKKTKVLLRELLDRDAAMRYVPVDISTNSITALVENLKVEFPGLEVAPQIGTYHQVLDRLKTSPATRRIFLLLGSNIGNLTHDHAIELLSSIKDAMDVGDLLFAGFDQKKDPEMILAAYNDSQGITEQFNKNLLLRINRELGATFDLDTFKHWPTYDPETGTVKSFLVSQKQQVVSIPSLKIEIPFRKWESIHMEISQKYDRPLIKRLAEASGLVVKTAIGDPKGWFKNYIFTKNMK